MKMKMKIKMKMKMKMKMKLRMRMRMKMKRDKPYSHPGPRDLALTNHHLHSSYRRCRVEPAKSGRANSNSRGPSLHPRGGRGDRSIHSGAPTHPQR